MVTDATDEDVVDDFRQVAPKAGWSSEFDLDGGELTLRFERNKRFILLYPTARDDTADDLFAIARRYGFFSSEVSSAYDSLIDRTAALLDKWDARPVTVGVSESDIAGEAAALASEWDEWIRNYGEEPESACVAEAQRQVLLVVQEVASSPSTSGIREYNAAIEQMNRTLSRCR